MAKASDEKLAPRAGRAAGGHSARHQGPVRHQGRPHPGGEPHPRRLQARIRIDRDVQSLARRRGDAGQAQHGRVRHGLVQRDLLLRPGDQSVARPKGSNAQLVPGGSSGGSAAAVSAWLCAGATATDTGGSIRQPAALTGTVGIKPTYGRCSRWGVVAFASSLDQAGPIARTVEDAAIMLDLDGGVRRQGFDQRRHGGPGFRRRRRARREGADHRHSASEYRMDGMPAEIEALWQQGIDWLKAEGATVRDISLPHTKYALPAYYIVAPAEASSNLARYDGVKYGLRVTGKDITDMYELTRAKGFGARGPAPPDDRHLRAVGRLLRRLLRPGAEGPHADQARLRGRLPRRRRRHPDPGDAVGGLRRRRRGHERRSGQDVPQRRLHGDGEHGRPAGHRRARRQGRMRACRSACSSSASRSTRKRCSPPAASSSARPASIFRRSSGGDHGRRHLFDRRLQGRRPRT